MKKKTTATVTINGGKPMDLDQLERVHTMVARQKYQGIEEMIEQSIINESTEIESVEINIFKQEIAIKSSSFSLPSSKVKSNEKCPPGINFQLAYNALKAHVNYFKDYNLPNESDLMHEFEKERKAHLQIHRGDFTEEKEDSLKKKILAKPSIEKIVISKLEFKTLTDGDNTIEYYLLEIMSINSKTGLLQTDELPINCRGLGDKEPEYQNTKSFLKDIQIFLNECKHHLKEIQAYIAKEMEIRKRHMIVEASQGKLFADEMNDTDMAIVKRLAKDIEKKRLLERGLKEEDIES